MDNKAYLKKSARTASGGNFDTGKVSLDALLCQLKRMALAANEADYVKKSLFYSRCMPDSHRINLIEHEKGSGGNLANIDIDIIHAALGLFTESGEIVEVIIKAVESGKDIDRVNLIEELGDIEWYLALTHRKIGVTSEEVKKKNIDKLKIRFPEKFTNDNANNRDLEKELSTISISRENNTNIEEELARCVDDIRIMISNGNIDADVALRLSTELINNIVSEIHGR
ncbi:MAG: nucleoside triphosphate pyrophosphohydrolase family protein [Pseudomonadota bacterium]